MIRTLDHFARLWLSAFGSFMVPTLFLAALVAVGFVLYMRYASPEQSRWRSEDVLRLAQRYPRVAALGYIADVLDEGRGAFLTSARHEGRALFRITPPGSRPDYFVVEYAEPLEGSATMLGADLAVDPAARAAAEQS